MTLALHVPWTHAARGRLRLDLLPFRATTLSTLKHNSSLSLHLSEETPAMQALKNQPYPTAPLNTSIFEEHTREYPDITRTRVRRRLKPATILKNLLSSRQYNKAESLRSELQEMGVPIRNGVVFEKAARHVLRAPEVTDRAKAFESWFSLYSDAHHSRPRRFTRIWYLVSSESDDIRLVMLFGKICASKGYGRKVAPKVIPHIVRFAEPSVAQAYLVQFNREVCQYASKHGTPDPSFPRISYNLAIRAQCLAGRLDEAMGMLQYVREQGIRVSSFTRLLLNQKLAEGNKVDNAIVPDWQQIDFHGQPIFNGAPLTMRDISPEERRTYLAAALRGFRKCIVAGRFPSHAHLTTFIQQCHLEGHTQAATLLRRKAFRHSGPSRSWWLMAELTFHHHRQQWRSVLITFANNFSTVGLPSEAKQYLTHFRRFRATKDRPHFPNLLMSRYYPPENVWPSPHHTVLAWTALVSLSRGSGLETLYNQLIHKAEAQHANPTALSRSERIDSAHFTPFLREFAARNGPERAAAVLRDMLKFGFRPNIWHWTVIASAFARAGDVNKAMDILGRLERSAELKESRSSPKSLPRPNLATYTAIIRGFVSARCLDEALEVERRMLAASVGYAPGVNALTDAALSRLRNLELRHNDYDSWKAQSARRASYARP